MKKIISITLAFVMLFSMTSFALTPEQAAGDLGKYGIMGGFPDGTLRLEQNVTRAQMTKMITIAMGELGYAGMQSSFKDVIDSHWAVQFIEFARNNNIVGGFPDGTFKPDDSVTCAQVLKMVVCMMEYDKYLLSYRKYLPNPQLYYPQDYLKVAIDLGLTDGLDMGDGNIPATRGFVAVVLSRALDAPLPYDPNGDAPFGSNSGMGWLIADGKDGRPHTTLRMALEK